MRVGNENETDIVGCCTLRRENITLPDVHENEHDETENEDVVVEFDFIGKHNVRYHKNVPVKRAVYRNLRDFVQGDTAQVFDQVTVSCIFMTFLKHKQLIILTPALY